VLLCGKSHVSTVGLTVGTATVGQYTYNIIVALTAEYEGRVNRGTTHTRTDVLQVALTAAYKHRATADIH
jgi:hypothetical protein